MNLVKKVIVKLKLALATILKIDERFDEVKINQGIILATLNQNKSSKNLHEYEFKVFSQWGEDGIIQHLINSIEIKNKTFIEFGIEDFSESNCRFLLMKDDWKGFVIDGSTSNIKKLKSSYFYWKHHLHAVDAFITKENIESILATSGFEEDLGLLSIDLDGNDFFILEAINSYKPRILICEYNPIFGANRKIAIPYQPDFQRTTAHHSNLYWGASLAAMTYLAEMKGYTLVGTNSAGNNAFYIRNDLLNDRVALLTAESAYSPSNYRESRDESGNLTHITAEKRLDVIRGLPVYEVEKEIIEQL
ncbi:hypothetical protein AOC19_01430 [Polynucleobacter asymbioticus]|uniref:hypothetical protein n=1 Tax=Polynucleobacter asymbioticus TaxID=576611 RepID=UPI001BFED33D|nr:hypothetical protein [Polynucleobacter asymbioticus]QWD85569.1 hypothetical protein AOC19_01430 [Polynucleobacter asymbioticus]